MLSFSFLWPLSFPLPPCGVILNRFELQPGSLGLHRIAVSMDWLPCGWCWGARKKRFGGRNLLGRRGRKKGKKDVQKRVGKWGHVRQAKWLEGRHLCHLCDARARTLLPHTHTHTYMSHTHRSVPPLVDVKKCPNCTEQRQGGGGAKHHFRWPPQLTISSGLGLLEGGICSTICTPLGEKYVLHPTLALSGCSRNYYRIDPVWARSLYQNQCICNGK